MKYVPIKSLDLSNASVVGLDLCVIEIEGSALVCFDEFERRIAIFPFDQSALYLLGRGLPNGVGIDEVGRAFEIETDFDDEDFYFDEPDAELLQMYSHVGTPEFTLVIRNY